MRAFGAVLTAALGLVALGGSAQADDVQVGMLTCELQDKKNYILFSQRKFDCSFDPAGDRGIERYEGEITNIGVDLEVTETEQIAWLVLAPSADVPSGALAGNYGGASASVTAGAGLGAKALVGGFQDSIALQPLSLAGSTGIGAAVAISGLKLTEAP